MKVNIKEEIAKELQEKVSSDKRFDNVDGYINYILQKVVDKMTKTKNKKSENFSKKDEEKIKQKLKSLGYLG